jgi:diguanylate cyclase
MYLRQVISLRDSRDMAVTDPLTGLANRAGFDDQLDRTLRRGESVAVLLIDLDGFKAVNDVHGHAAGDTLLAEFARVLRSAVRREDVAARVGGDEFVLVLSDITDPSQAVTVAHRILAVAAASPVGLDGGTVPVRASIGIATGTAADGAKELIRRADVAMYTAKRAGSHGWQLYDASMVDRRARDGELAEQLRGALADHQFEVLYQPLVDLSDGLVRGVEALLRWHHPRLGSVSPAEFIPIAERSRLINEIGLWVLEQACRQVRAWHELNPRLYASVNLSPRQLQEPGLVEDVQAVLARTGLPANRLVLEVTESAVVDQQVAVPALFTLRALGVRIAIDDFGTGYSSLHYLTRLPVDVLKIDRGFVSELNGTPGGAAVTEAIIRLGQVLDLGTVAEGIETAAQADELLRLGCRTGQGYLYARPVPPADLEAMMRNQAAAAPRAAG